MTQTDLIARYGEERLPRYTSYPTAPHFSPAVTRETYAQWLSALRPHDAVSLYLHVPFCRAMCWYCGCNTTVARRDEPVTDYLVALRSEIAMAARTIGRRLAAGHIHFGGGTPTIMTPSQFEQLVALIHSHFEALQASEFAVEIDPRTLAPDMIRAFAATGVTRASLGVQSFDVSVQRAINRVQSFAETARATDGLRHAGVRGLNFDIVYGLPLQTVQSCIETVKTCLQLRPERFSVFGYAHVPSFKKHQRRIDEAALPDGPARDAQATAIAETLTAAGYVPIGMDHFALPSDALAQASRAGTLRRNFQGYTTDMSDVLIGFGASAIGQFRQGYVQNEPAIRAYAKAVLGGRFATARGYALTDDDRMRGAIIERLMCNFEVNVATTAQELGIAAGDVLTLAPRLAALADDGLVTIDGPAVRIAQDARQLVRTVASCFDAHLAPAQRLHSRAV